MALQRADNENIPSYHLSAKKFGSEELLAKEILTVLSEYNIDMIFLAGYMRMLHISILEKYNNRIFNIHPALLPKYGGKGMYETVLNDNLINEVKEECTSLVRDLLKDDLVEIVLYGSCARGDYTEDSDIDIALLTRVNRLEAKKYEDDLATIATEIAMEHLHRRTIKRLLVQNKSEMLPIMTISILPVRKKPDSR